MGQICCTSVNYKNAICLDNLVLKAKFVEIISNMVLVLKKGASKKEINAIRKKLEKLPAKGVDTKKYCGVIKLKKDPLAIQKNMRNEWK